MSDVASISVIAAIISLSHTHQVISLKLTNPTYVDWRMQMLPYLLGQGNSLSLPAHACVI